MAKLILVGKFEEKTSNNRDFFQEAEELKEMLNEGVFETDENSNDGFYIQKAYPSIFDFNEAITRSGLREFTGIDKVVVLDSSFENLNDTANSADEIATLSEAIENLGSIHSELLVYTADIELYSEFKKEVDQLKKDSNSGRSPIGLETFAYTFLRISYDSESLEELEPNNFLASLKGETRNKDLVKPQNKFNYEESNLESLKEVQKDRESRTEDNTMESLLENMGKNLEDETDTKEVTTQTKEPVIEKEKLVNNSFKEEVKVPVRRQQPVTNTILEQKDIKFLQSSFLSLEASSASLILSKLKEDKGVFLTSGFKSGGSSALTANIAEIYASLSKKILLVDLDLDSYGLTSFFPEYKDRALEQGKQIDNLSFVINGGRVVESVNINSYISLTSSLGDKNNNHYKTILSGVNGFLEKNRDNYDLIIIDLPFERLEEYINTSYSNTDKFLFFVNNEYLKINALTKELKKNPNIITNSVLFLNQVDYSREYKDNLVSNKKTIDYFLNKDADFNELIIAGETAFENEMESQKQNGVRLVNNNQRFRNNLTKQLAAL